MAGFDDVSEVRVIINTKDGQQFEYRFRKPDMGRGLDVKTAYNVKMDAMRDGYYPLDQMYLRAPESRTFTLEVRH